MSALKFTGLLRQRRGSHYNYMLNILFIGDINGRIGRKTVIKLLPKIKKQYNIDLTIANGENAAHGAGITNKIAEELNQSGIDWITSGDHAFDQTKQLTVYDKKGILRPVNYPPQSPGIGYSLISVGRHQVLLINLIGRVFMEKLVDCPFQKIKKILNEFSLLSKKISAIIIDIHAEATSEKISLLHFIDGQVSAVLGTHTHVMTADARITNKGTAYITDVGMVGANNQCLGVEKEGIIKTFLTQIKHPHIIPQKGEAIFNAVILKINPKTKKATNIKTINQTININN